MDPFMTGFPGGGPSESRGNYCLKTGFWKGGSYRFDSYPSTNLLANLAVRMYK